jgi:hypothetical protein
VEIQQPAGFLPVVFFENRFYDSSAGKALGGRLCWRAFLITYTTTAAFLSAMVTVFTVLTGVAVFRSGTGSVMGFYLVPVI